MLKYYSNYLNNMAKSPNESWREAQQEIINRLFEDTTILTTIEEENMPFDFTFNEIATWVDTVTEATLNAEKDDSDYRAIYFQDCTHTSSRGRYYRFSDNYWIVYSDPCIEDTMAMQKVRRCNNWLKWVDKDTGVLYEYPCVLDYSISSTNAQTARLIQQANSHVVLIIQGNEDTLKLAKNTRFLFNGVCYRLFAINNYMQNNYVDQDTPIIFYDLYEEMTIDTDNLDENIADDIRENYRVVTNTEISNINGYTDTIDVTAYNIDTEIDNPILTFASSDTDVVTVDENGIYKIVGNVGDTATITIQIKNNKYATATIDVTVVETISDNYKIVINDSVTKLSQGDTVTLTAYTYNNNDMITDTSITCTPNWSDSNYYTLLKVADNTWELTNIKPSSNTLILTFNSSNYTAEITQSIKLTAMW